MWWMLIPVTPVTQFDPVTPVTDDSVTQMTNDLVTPVTNDPVTPVTDDPVTLQLLSQTCLQNWSHLVMRHTC